MSSSSARINEQIRARELRVIGKDGEQIGIISRDEALEKAREAGVDLVEISPQSDPPVAKIIDWGKYQYQKMKDQQKSRKKSKQAELKQMRFGLKIGSGDLDIKLRKIRTFLDAKHKVRIQISFRGREMAHKELGFELADRIVAQLNEEEDIAIEQKPQIAGRNLSLIIRSKK